MRWRWLAVVAVLVMAVAACGGDTSSDDEGDASEPTEAATEETQASEATEPATEDTEPATEETAMSGSGSGVPDPVGDWRDLDGAPVAEAPVPAWDITAVEHADGVWTVTLAGDAQAALDQFTVASAQVVFRSADGNFISTAIFQKNDAGGFDTSTSGEPAPTVGSGTVDGDRLVLEVGTPDGLPDGAYADVGVRGTLTDVGEMVEDVTDPVPLG